MRLFLLLAASGALFAQNQASPLYQNKSYVLTAPTRAARVVSYVPGGNMIAPHTGTSTALGVTLDYGVTGDLVTVVTYGTATCEFDGPPVLYNVAVVNDDKCHDSGKTALADISTAMAAFGRTTVLHPEVCPNCADVLILFPSSMGRQIQSSQLNGNFVSTDVLNPDNSITYTWANGTTTNVPRTPVQIMFDSGGSNVAAGQFVGVSYSNAQEQVTQQVIALGGHVTALYCVTSKPPGGTVVVTYTLRQNGASTAATCSITGTALKGSTTGLSVAIAPGDLLNFMVPATIGGATGNVAFAVSIGP